MSDYDPTRPAGPEPLVEILRERVPWSLGALFRIVEARLRFRRFDGRMSAPITRISFERGDAAGVLLYDPQRDAVLLVRQFRFPLYAALDPEARAGEGARQAWILETVAGIADGDQTGPQVAQRELLEESGYAVSGPLHRIATVYPSPGASSERIHLYWGEVDATHKVAPGGGLEEEGEDTEVVAIPLNEALAMIASGEIQDAKTILALQHLALALK
jgi:ADP-ribose pyrophosphatase